MKGLGALGAYGTKKLDPPVVSGTKRDSDSAPVSGTTVAANDQVKKAKADTFVLPSVDSDGDDGADNDFKPPPTKTHKSEIARTRRVWSILVYLIMMIFTGSPSSNTKGSLPPTTAIGMYDR
jgi:hypothetical protein